MTEPERDSDAKELGWMAFAVMGTTIALCVALGVALGVWADHLVSSSPLCLLLGIVLGSASAVVSVVQQVRRFL